MKAESTVQIEKTSIELYKKIMSNIEFMKKYKNDPKIFDPDSENFKNFIIQSFYYLQPNFHYLPFLSKEDVDLEIIRVAGVFQILPSNAKKVTKLFENMSKEDIHKFWLKFFTLFKHKSNFTAVSLCGFNWENKVHFFKDITNTLNYLQYEFPVININKLNCININEEIGNWEKQFCSTEITSDESESFINNKECKMEVDFGKLTIDLKQIASMYNNQKTVNRENKSEHVEFFNNFISLSKNIFQYKKDLTIINSVPLDEFNFIKFSNDDSLTDDLYFIKKFNSFAKLLKLKMKALY